MSKQNDNQRLAKRYARLNAGKKMTLQEFQDGFKQFCKSIMKSKKTK